MSVLQKRLVTTSETVSSMDYSGRKELTPSEKIVFQNLWYLPPYQARKLDDSQDTLFLTTVGSFLEHLELEQYPRTWNDRFLTSLPEDSGSESGSESGNDDGYEQQAYYISYLFCSGSWLDDLAADSPDSMLAFKLRSIVAANFFHCIVRPVDKKWNLEQLVRNGAKVV